MEPIYEQLTRRIEGNRKVMHQAGDIFMSMISRRALHRGETNQLDVARLQQLFTSQGIFFRQVSLEGAWWRRTTGRILAFTVEDDLPVILEPGFASYSYVHPLTGRSVRITGSSFSSQLKPEAFCLTQPLPSHALSLADLGRFAWRSLSRADLGYIGLACVSVVLLTMFTPYVTKIVFSEVIPSGNASALLPVAVLLFSAALGLVMLQITRSLVVFRVKDKLEYTLQTALMTRLLLLPASFFRRWSAGDLSTRVLSLSRFSGLLTEEMLSTMLSMLFTAILFIQFFIYGGPLLFIGIGILAVMLFFILLNYHYVRLVQERITPHRSRMLGLLYELLGGMQKVKTNGAEERVFYRWAQEFANAEVNSASQPPMYFYSSSIAFVIKLMPMIVTMWAAWYYGLSLSDYIAYCVVLGIALDTVNKLGNVIKHLGRVLPEARQCEPILAATPEDSTSKTVLTHLEGSIKLSGLRFRYTDTAPWLFDDFNLDIRPGEYVGIVGPSGCGKSTLLRLLLGFEEPQEGHVFYDNHPLDEINKSSLRRHCVGAVLQHGRLIEGTLLENILFTATGATEDDAWEAARLVALDDDIRRMPNGMNTLITEDGQGISGGQRQRILLARTLVQRPDILLLDEPTSALDNVTQQRVSDALSALHCTRIAVAHRRETLRQCDRIIQL